MKKFSLKEVLLPTVSLFLIAAVCTALLAFTNSITAPKIAENSVKAENEARSVVFENAEFSKKEKTVGAASYVEALDESGNVIGYVFTTSQKGYGGDIKVMTGIDKDGNVTGMEILSISETAGLGMNAKKDDFKNQYIGTNGKLSVVKNDAGENEIKALTGATITSNAVTSAVNEAVSIFNSIKGGGK